MAPEARKPAIAAVPVRNLTSNQQLHDDDSTDEIDLVGVVGKLGPRSSSSAPHLPQASFRDNEFSSNDLPHPTLRVHPPGEQPRAPTDDEERSQAPSRHSDFKSITTVEDLGFSVGLAHNIGRHRSQERPCSETAAPGGGSLPSLHRYSSDYLEVTQGNAHSFVDEIEVKDTQQDLNGLGHIFNSPETQLWPDAEAFKEELDAGRYIDHVWGTRLREKSRECKHDSNSEENFLPLDKLVKSLSSTNIGRVLHGAFPHETDEEIGTLTSNIYSDRHEKSRRMILAILILVDGVVFIKDFIKHSIFDDHLPLRADKHKRPVKFHTRKDPDGIICFSNWSQSQKESFEREQYHVLAPFLDMKKDHVHFYSLENKIRLPFLEWVKKEKGGYGTIWKVKIHPAHHNFIPTKSQSANPYFAVKEIHSENHEAYRDEVRVLERFSGQQQGHPHLIRLLIAFQHWTKYYLLFEWADGNLVDLWKSHRLSASSSDAVRWLIQQCLGMAEGLMKIHDHGSWSNADKNRGRHGDIKPEDILFFKSPEDKYPHLVISDFGLTRFHSPHSVSNVAPNQLMGLSRTYRPLEFDTQSPISQAYDMWSLGCVYLEFVSWFLVGYEQTRKTFQDARIGDDVPFPCDSYQKEDKFFNLSQAGIHAGIHMSYAQVPQVKKSVTDWILYLQGHENCSQAIRDFLEQIKTKLLVPKHRFRDKINMFRSHLVRIWTMCESSKGYCMPSAVGSCESSAPLNGDSTTSSGSEKAAGDSPVSSKYKDEILKQLQIQRAELKPTAPLSSMNAMMQFSEHIQSTQHDDNANTETRASHDGRLMPVDFPQHDPDDSQPSWESEEEDGPRPDHTVPPSLTRDETDTTIFLSQLSQSGQFQSGPITPPLTPITAQNSFTEEPAQVKVEISRGIAASQHSVLGTSSMARCPVNNKSNTMRNIPMQETGKCENAEGEYGSPEDGDDINRYVPQDLTNHEFGRKIPNGLAPAGAPSHVETADHLSTRSTVHEPEEQDRTSRDTSRAESTELKRYSHPLGGSLMSSEPRERGSAVESVTGRKRERLRRCLAKVKKWISGH